MLDDLWIKLGYWLTLGLKWRHKIGRVSETVFFYFPPEFKRPPENLTQPPMGMGTLYDVLHDVHTIKSRMLEIIFVNDKNAPETVLRIRKIQVLS